MPRNNKRKYVDLTRPLAVIEHEGPILSYIAGLFWQRKKQRGIRNPTWVIFTCTDGKEVQADLDIVAFSAALLDTLKSTQVGKAPSQNENGDFLLDVPVESDALNTMLQCIYGHEIDEVLSHVGFEAFPAVLKIAMYLQATNVVRLLIKWASEIVDHNNAIKVLRFATTVAVGQELPPDLQQQIGDLIKDAVEHFGDWETIIRDSAPDSDSHSAEAAEALAMLLALDLDALSNFFARTRPCTDFVGFLVLWANSQPQRLADVGTLLLNLSKHEPFGETLSQVCASAADLRQIEDFVAKKVTDPGVRLVLNAVFAVFPRLYSRSQQPGSPQYAPTSPSYSPTSPRYSPRLPETPGYAPTSPAYASDDEEPQTPGYAPGYAPSDVE